MSAVILSGRDVAARIKENLSDRVAQLKARGVTPGLAAILAGEHQESVAYVSYKQRDCASVGAESFVYRLRHDSPQDELLALIRQCNEDPLVHGILLQHPLPAHLDENVAIRAMDPRKDIDGLTPHSVGELVMGNPGMVAPTALAALALIHETGQEISGKRAVVIGRSNIVGKPVASLLLRENATVTVCHSRTRDLASITREADILVVALGKARYITREYVKPGAIVIDCGYNRVEGQKGDVGDVDFEQVADVAGWISPVPGGVGPSGRALLIANCVRAAEELSSALE